MQNEIEELRTIVALMRLSVSLTEEVLKQTDSTCKNCLSSTMLYLGNGTYQKQEFRRCEHHARIEKMASEIDKKSIKIVDRILELEGNQ